MPIKSATGRPPLAIHVDAATANRIRNRVLTGARLAEIGQEIGATEAEVYNYVRNRRERWLREANFESSAIAKGHIVVWKSFVRASGSRDYRPITLPGTTMQRNMLAEAAR